MDDSGHIGTPFLAVIWQCLQAAREPDASRGRALLIDWIRYTGLAKGRVPRTLSPKPKHLNHLCSQPSSFSVRYTVRRTRVTRYTDLSNRS